MIWDKLSKKEKIGLSAALAFLALAFLDRLLISPVRTKFNALNQQIRISEKQLGGDMRNINQKKFIGEEYEQYLPYIRRSGSDEEEVAKILGEIEALARKSSVYLVDMKPRKPREVEFYKEYTVEIEAEGGMESLMSFIYQLNTSSQLLRVETLRLNLTKGDSNVLSASMLITKVLIL
ncbi:MAG: type 4a pilus biogenesis protein PilO [Candidatus Omnitrophica bacterium]|nr:type 4a pilus biogenesis protein PilO [Candidatus Omnitrophota bacterium]MBI5024117.1 type 4a pilus biogenesis protein PilO [Candidatus Omnitrophota bacterium]